MSCTPAITETPQARPTAVPFSVLDPIRHSEFQELSRSTEFRQPIRRSLALDFGPQLLNLKASYLENSEPSPRGSMAAAVRRHVNLFGSTTFGGSSWTGEGELSYSPREFSTEPCACPDWPRMARLGIKSRWQQLSYGADFRTVEKGFAPFGQAMAAQSRDSGELWGEYNLGPLNIRGAIGETWEELLDESQLRVTRTMGTAIRLNRSVWGGAWVSSYGLAEQGIGLSQELTIFSTAVSGFYRPVSALSMSPSFTLVEERQPDSGIRIETPRAEFSITYTPYKDEFRLTSGTFYSRSFDNFGLSDVTNLGARAGFDWKLGKFLGRDDTLSFNLNYNRRRDAAASSSYHDELLGLLQLKIIGY